jgi:DNA-binding response OmpR family regulator
VVQFWRVARGIQQVSLILFERGVLDDAALERALSDPELDEARLLARLGEEGYAEADLVSALAQRSGLPGIDLSRSVLSLKPLDLIPRAVAETDLMLPLSSEGGRLHVAMLSPEDAARATDEVRFISGMDVSTYVAIAGPLERTIAEAYDARERGESFLRGSAVPPNSPPPGQSKLTMYLPGQTPADPAVRARTGEIFSSERPAEVVELSEEDATEEATLEVVEELEPEPAVRPPRAAAGPQAKGKGAAGPQAKGKGAAGPQARGKAAAGADADFSFEVGPEEDDGAEVVGSVRVGPKQVLVVDDEPDILRLLERALKASGFAVRTAADGAKAEEALAAATPDLVLLDAMLPHVHGFEICSRIKSNPRLRAVPVIMMSAVYRGWRFAKDARDAYGADDYIEKPFHLADLLQRVEGRLAEGTRKPPPQKAKAEELLRRGLALLEEKKLQEARAALDLAVKEDPFSPRCQIALARALVDVGDVFRAITHYERAVELRPGLFPALRNLAALYMDKGFRSKAAETLERAMQHAPDPKTREQVKTQLLRLL